MQDTHGYLGEFPIDIKTHVVFKTYTNVDWAMTYIAMYGQIDGAHHKSWVIDQVARILLGTQVVVTEARWERHAPEYRYCVGDPSTGYVEWRKNVMEAPIEEEEPSAADNDADMWGWEGESYDEGSPP